MSLNKRKLHHYLRVAQALKTWQLAIIFVFMLFVSATLLRLNNLGMVERRQAVIEADQQGDQAAIQKSLQELRNYVNSHMNTSLGDGVYLEHSYNRARDAALEQAASATNPNSAAYQQASVECRSRFRGGVQSYRNDYVQCVIDRVGTLTQAEDPLTGVNMPKADAYRHDFVSPVWSVDAAGLAVLSSLLLLVIMAIKTLTTVVVRSLLQRHHQRFNS